MANYDVVCDYVYERVFVRFPDFNRVARGVSQGLAQAMATTETMATQKTTAVGRNNACYERKMN